MADEKKKENTDNSEEIDIDALLSELNKKLSDSGEALDEGEPKKEEEIPFSEEELSMIYPSVEKESPKEISFEELFKSAIEKRISDLEEKMNTERSKIDEIEKEVQENRVLINKEEENIKRLTDNLRQRSIIDLKEYKVKIERSKNPPAAVEEETLISNKPAPTHVATNETKRKDLLSKLIKQKPVSTVSQQTQAHEERKEQIFRIHEKKPDELMNEVIGLLRTRGHMEMSEIAREVEIPPDILSKGLDVLKSHNIVKITTSLDGKTSVEYMKGKIKEKDEVTINDLSNLIAKKESLAMSEIINALDIDKHKIEEWLDVLEKHNMIKIKYPLIGEPTVMAVK